MLVDHSQMKLGKRAAKLDVRTLRLAKYFTPALPAQPSKLDWSRGVQNWGMLGNDTLGDCTIAGALHAEQSISINVDKMLVFSTADAQKYYSLWAGWVPGDPSTDQGAAELDILNQWRQQKLCGHQLIGYADPDPGNLDHIQKAIALFGGVYIGLGLPLSAQSQDVWDVAGPLQFPRNQPNSWGGHAVWVIGYDEVARTLLCITWGGLKVMTFRFWLAYCDEAHALVMGYWFRKGAAPSSKIFGDAGFDELFRIDQMTADVAALAG